jgi:hypothetical protein
MLFFIFIIFLCSLNTNGYFIENNHFEMSIKEKPIDHVPVMSRIFSNSNFYNGNLRDNKIQNKEFMQSK